MLDTAFINDSIKKLKDYRARIFKLLPSELSDFLKLKNTFTAEGVILSDSMLNKPSAEIVNYVISKLSENQKLSALKVEESIDIDTSDLINAETAIFEDERAEIRRQLFNGDIVVKVIQTGRSFNVSWNVKMNTCKINIPSTWNIDADQSLLLDLYSKSFHASPDQIAANSVNNMSPLANLVNDLLSRHSDYSVIKQLISIELSCNNELLLKGINKHKLRQLMSRGLSQYASALIIVLHEQINNKLYTRQDIVDILGFRTRLIRELDGLLV
jgi:hypothetical protein